MPLKMPSFQGHHCPVCGQMGDTRCITLGHYKQCRVHPENYHAKYTNCVKCTSAKKREEREAKSTRDEQEREKESERTRENEEWPKKGPKKLKKKPRAKPDHEKSIKQLRKERKALKKSGAMASVTSFATTIGEEDGGAETDGEQLADEGVSMS